MAAKQIDALMVRKMFLAGARNLENHKALINELNVFPVPDGDTGTNMRRTLEGALPGVRVMYLNGCQGDTNHYDITLDPKAPERAYFPYRGYERARYMGQAIAGGVLQVWMKALPAEGPDRVRYCLRDLDTPANMPDPAELPEAERIIRLYEEGREDALKAINPSLITVLGEAFRKVRLAKGATRCCICI